MAAGEDVALEPAFALMLGELLDDLAGDGHVLVDEGRQIAVVPLLLRDLVGRVQSVGSGLVRSEDAERIRVVLDDVAAVRAQRARSLDLAPAMAVLLDAGDLVLVELRELQILTIRPPLAFGLAPMRSSPFGMNSVTSSLMEPSALKSSSGL